ncbi:MAG: NCS2 family permease [bacterium]|nr:NCS2 family permease [bacterium]
MYERLFRLREHGTTVGREAIGGASTFLAMSYIIIVQPVVLGAAGMDHGGVFVATCACSAFACILMGLWSNLPIALAPAMGHNFFFAFTVCGATAVGGFGWAWPEALAANLIAGVLFTLMASFGLQEALIRGIPDSLKYAIAVGIGLLIAFVGLQWAGIVVHHPVTYVKLGNLRNPVVLLSVFGLTSTAIMLVRGVRAALLLGVLLTAAVGLIASHFMSASWGYSLVEWKGEFVAPVPDPSPTAFAVFGGLKTLFSDHSLGDWLTIIFVFLILDVFDTAGTLVGVAERAGLIKDGTIVGAKQALLSDGVGTVAGTIMGTSTITSYVESAAGISAGARTGLASVITGLLLAGALFFHPLVEMVGGVVAVDAASLGAVASVTPTVACHPIIAPVLIVIGCYMLPAVAKIKWTDLTEALPAFLTIIIMQFGLSISHGIAWGFITYVLLKLVTGRVREIHPLVALFSVLLGAFLATS